MQLDGRKLIGRAIEQIDRMSSTGALRNCERIRLLISTGDIAGARAEYDRHCAKTTKETVLDLPVDLPWFGAMQAILGGSLAGIATAIGVLGVSSVEFSGERRVCDECKLPMRIDFEGRPICTTRGCEPTNGPRERITIDRRPIGGV